jgi:hypothetical protein
MASPWNLTATENNAAATYPVWVGSKYSLYHNRPCLCNWYPLSILVEFAAAHGFRLTLNHWPGRASTEPGGVRSWDTRSVREHDSHGGAFNSKEDYKRRVESTVTARMIGTLNTVAVVSNYIRVGDMLLRNYSDRYWHVELIIKIDGDVITTEAGSTPKIKPNTHVETYRRGDLKAGKVLYENAARRWGFNKITSVK